jgi:pimeloyl-ACP methyl ester carboxylesterase
MLEKVTLKTSDGIAIIGDHYKVPTPSAGILLLHMMPSTKESYKDFAQRLNNAEIGVLAVDLRGHGESDKGPAGYEKFSDDEHQKSIEDVKAGINFQKTEGHVPLFVGGASIGANLALQILAESDFVTKAILLSPGLNYKGIESLPLAEKIDPEKAVYIVAAKDDSRTLGTAAEQGQQIFNVLNCRKQTQIFETGSHGTNMLDAHPEFMDDLVNWLKDV